MLGKCSHCKQDFVIRGRKKDYIFKLKEFKTMKLHYFCSYSCLQAERKTNSEKYAKSKE